MQITDRNDAGGPDRFGGSVVGYRRTGTGAEDEHDQHGNPVRPEDDL